jgi:hypothetical protein
VSSVAGGGNCGQGAASAVFGKFTSNAFAGMGGGSPSAMIARGVATSIAGGVGSTIAGGKFENGAVTAAFGYLFNELLHQSSKIQQGYASRQTKWAYDNGWIDASENSIDTSIQDRQMAHDMADGASKGLAYGAAACAVSVVCPPAAPGIAAMGLVADVLKNFVFSLKPATFGVDLAVDVGGDLLGKYTRVGPMLRTYAQEQIKDSGPAERIKKAGDAALGGR